MILNTFNINENIPRNLKAKTGGGGGLEGFCVRPCLILQKLSVCPLPGSDAYALMIIAL